MAMFGRLKPKSWVYLLAALGCLLVLRGMLWDENTMNPVSSETSLKEEQSPPKADPASYDPQNDAVTVFSLSKGDVAAVRAGRLPGEASWKPEKRPLCTREQVVNGQWVPTVMDHPPYVTSTVHLRCYPREFYYKKEGWETYKWQPEDWASKDCEYTKWRTTTFCNIMKGGTVAIIGDSLSWEHYSSLVQLHGQSTHQGYQHQSLELHMNIQQPVCDGKTRIVYRRDDKLQNLTAALHETFPTVVVLNRGAHYVNDTLLLPEIRHNLEEVGVWLQVCKSLELKCHFFWRTSVPGHPNCGADKEPINDLAAIEARIGDLSHYDNRTINYHWYDYQHQNELVLKELEASGLDYSVIDAYPLNVRRPDEHRAHQGDCLHNCYPGKMDVYSELMLHYLRGRQSKDDAERTEYVAATKEFPLHETTKYDRAGWEEARRIRTGGK